MVPELEGQARKLEAELKRLTNAFSRGEEPDSVTDAIRERDKQLKALEARLAAMKTTHSAIDLELRRMQKESEARVTELNALIDQKPRPT